MLDDIEHAHVELKRRNTTGKRIIEAQRPRRASRFARSQRFGMSPILHLPNERGCFLRATIDRASRLGNFVRHRMVL